jgi:hypothetical protein
MGGSSSIFEFLVVVYPRTVYTDLNGLWLLGEWHEVSLRALAGPTADVGLAGV